MAREPEVVISVDHISKDFILPHEKVTTVKGLFTSFYKRHHKTRSVQHALRDVSFEIKKGEFFGIVGRNGSGKSTMLKMLAGIYQPTKGRIQVGGKLVPFIELGVGFNPELTGRENVYLNGAMMGFSEKEVGTMYDDIVAFAELEEFMDQKLKNYSSGMQVRLAFAVAIKAEADVLLIDEVLAVGDAAFQRKCYDYFKSLRRNKKTVIFVSHDMSAIREYCDRVALIEASRVEAVGNPSSIADKYERLFAEKTIEEIGFTADNRWGTGAVRAKDLRLSKTKVDEDDSSLSLTVTLEAKDGVYAPGTLMTGFRVINAAGQCVNEANTWDKATLPTLKPGESCKVIWEFPNIYTPGTYHVGLFTNADEQVADSWDDALRFEVKGSMHKGVIVNPRVDVKVESGVKARP